MLAMMALGALLAVGPAGPVLAMVALMLPPDSKSFGLSAFHSIQSVIEPSASVVLGVVLQARALDSMSGSMQCPHERHQIQGAALARVRVSARRVLCLILGQVQQQ